MLHVIQTFRDSWRRALIVPVLLSLTACYVDATPDKEDRWNTGKKNPDAYTYSLWEQTPDSTTYEYVSCRDGSQGLCGRRPDSDTAYTWNSSCKGRDCAILSVFTHYTMSENLGANQTLTIEAFNNPKFLGNPSASLEIAGFDGSAPHSTGREEIYLSPGEYYFRAYVHAPKDILVPYPLNGMELVGEKPLGVYGALSGAKRVLVRRGDDNEPIHISIDQLFMRPGSEVDTQAKIRIKFKLDASIVVPANRQLRILLLKNPDIEEKPVYQFSMSSNLLLSPGSDETLEFLSPSLKAGTYFLMSYLDQDGDELFDESEARGYFRVDEKFAPIKIEVEKAKLVTLHLGHGEVAGNSAK